MTPFRPVRATLAVAGCWAIAALVWLAAGDALPGGRWLSIHLFTLGVLTNLLADLMRHFSGTLLHVRDDTAHPRVRLAVRNAALLAVLYGRVETVTPLLGAGATVASAEVLLGWWDVRRMRRRALPARHTPLVRAYQRSYGAFLHAALLGALLGSGAIPGRWYVAVRLAHVHVAVLGWAGVPLLATLVFLGPTLLRARTADRADVHARRLLPYAAMGVTVAALALVSTPVTGTAGRLVAAIGVAAFAVAATVICADVLATMRRAAAPSLALAAALGWLVVAAWADVVVLATNDVAYLDAVGAMTLVGALAPVVIVSAGYLWAMSAGADATDRAARLRAVARWSTARAMLWNAGAATLVAALVARAAGAGTTTGLPRAGTTLVVASAVVAVVAVLLPRRA